jgi:signal transduction histidine kinase
MSDGAAAVDVAATGEDSGIPKPVATQAYLAIRGAVRNATKHSGCSRVGVSLEVTDGELCGVVEDDGEGLDPEGAERTTPSWGGPEVDEGEGRDARRERACRVRARLRHEGGD